MKKVTEKDLSLDRLTMSLFVHQKSAPIPSTIFVVMIQTRFVPLYKQNRSLVCAQ